MIHRAQPQRAVQITEVIILNKAVIKRVDTSATLLNKLIYNIALSNSEKLRRSTIEHVNSLEKQLELITAQNEFGHIFIYILVCYSVGMILLYLLFTNLKWIDIYTSSFNWLYLSLLFIPSLMVLRKTGIAYAQLGITTHQWRPALLEGLIASAMVLALLIGIYFSNQKLHYLPLKTPYPAGIWILTYGAHAFIQEFITRGLIQTSFQRFFNDEKGLKSVLLTSILFGMIHLHFGFSALFITLITGIIFGLFYLRHHNLIGVSLLHWVAGGGAFLIGLL
ncbi:MAG: CPBP family intramembrane glutamic endopeptidase [Methylococcaceae bacterium]